MKVQCSCGAKSEFDLTPEMASSPVKFVCPACGLDASEFVDGLVRQELGQTATPAGVPIPVAVTRPVAAADAGGATGPPPARPAVRVRTHTPEVKPAAAQAPAEPAAPAGPPCPKHPGEFAVEKCYVCSKPICPKCMELFGYVCSPLCKAKANSHGIELPVYEGQRSVIEARQWRQIVRVSVAAGVVVVVLLGFWFWYAWFGSLPEPVFSVRFEERSYSGQTALAGKDHDQLVFLHGATLARHDLKAKRAIWSRDLLDHAAIQAEVDKAMKANKDLIDKANGEGWEHVPKMPSFEKLTREAERAAAEAMQLHVRSPNIWVASPGKLVRYDWDTGQPVKELTVPEGYGGVLTRGDELVVVDTRPSPPLVTRINLASGESSTEELGGRAAAVAANSTGSVAVARGPDAKPMAGLPTGMPGKDAGQALDPGKVAAQAGHLSLPERIALPATLAGNLNQERALAQLDDPGRRQAAAGESGPPSVSLIPAKDGFIELSVKLLESHIVARDAMKPAAGRSALEGNVTAGRSMEVASDLLNEMQRQRGGGVVQENLSRYQVKVTRPGTECEWVGEVIGPPTLYPLETVSVLAANKSILVLDKANKKLWESALMYNVEGGLDALEAETATCGQGPCVERKGSLYVYDEGVLSAFDLATGNVRWRLPSVGIAGLFFDDKDRLYVNTTTASPERLKFSRQIDLSQKAMAVLLKLDSRNGKVLWTADPGGLISHVEGKFIFTVQSYMPEEPDEDDPYHPDTGFEAQPYLRIRRIDPKDGHELWEHFQQRAPLDVAFERNTIRLVFRKEVQVLKFLAF